jgi:hypothetical protein
MILQRKRGPDWKFLEEDSGRWVYRTKDNEYEVVISDDMIWIGRVVPDKYGAYSVINVTSEVKANKLVMFNGSFYFGKL